jgi:hypothetical protein
MKEVPGPDVICIYLLQFEYEDFLNTHACLLIVIIWQDFLHDPALLPPDKSGGRAGSFKGRDKVLHQQSA